MKKILITDDSFIMRNWVGKILKSEGYEVREAVNGDEALKEIKTNEIDLVILDLLMPNFDGLYFLEKLKEDEIDTDIIVLSADIQKSTKEKVLSYGVKAFLNKPPEPDKLLTMINQILA